MTAAAQRAETPEYLARDILDTLEQLRLARTLNPKHEPPYNRPHTGCDVCLRQRRFDYLCDQLSRPASWMNQEQHP